jgi:hemoglobin-like flavoprotein
LLQFIITKLDGSSTEVLRDSLEHLARVHNQRGVTADHYSVMGMVLIHTVRLCTGEVFFTNGHRDAWVREASKTCAQAGAATSL